MGLTSPKEIPRLCRERILVVEFQRVGIFGEGATVKRADPGTVVFSADDADDRR